MATSKSFNSGTVEDTCNLFAPNWGVFGVDRSNCVIQTYPRPTFVAMVTSRCYLNTKLVFITRLLQEICPRFLHQTGFRSRPIYAHGSIAQQYYILGRPWTQSRRFGLVLDQLHWLWVRDRIQFPLCVLTYRCLNATASQDCTSLRRFRRLPTSKFVGVSGLLLRRRRQRDELLTSRHWAWGYSFLLLHLPDAFTRVI